MYENWGNMQIRLFVLAICWKNTKTYSKNKMNNKYRLGNKKNHNVNVFTLNLKKCISHKWLTYFPINAAVVLRGKILPIYVRNNIMNQWKW